MTESNMVDQPPHVLILPLPLQGPINSMLKLAELLCLHHIKVTFITTQHIQRRLFNCTNTEIHFSKYHDSFQFQSIPDGLPEDNPRTALEFSELMESLEASAAPFLKERVESGAYDLGGHPVSCIIADGIFRVAGEIAGGIGKPILYFETISPCGLWSYLCLPKLIEHGELPFKDENLDEIITNTGGMEGILRRRDLPSFCRSIDYTDVQVQLVFSEIHNIPLSQGLILNTFQQLDAPILSHILTFSPKLYALGPLHTHLQTKLKEAPINSSSIWKEDKSCISWLDKQPCRSVLYVSIGSLTVMTKDEFSEILHGLVNSGSRFLWVWRPGSVSGADSEFDEIVLELLRSVGERGCVVSWAPQQEVLAHSAVGGFFTHCGWNSTLESVAAGKPIIGWPHYVDQQVNSRFVGEVWKVGLDMKDSCDRVVVEKMVREVMELRKDEFLRRAEELAESAKQSVSEGGSSAADLDRLIHDIKFMKLSSMK